MQKNKLKKSEDFEFQWGFFCRTLKYKVNPRRAKEKYQIVKKKHIMKISHHNGTVEKQGIS